VTSFSFRGTSPDASALSRSFSREELRNVRMTAIAPDSPMFCYLQSVAFRLQALCGNGNATRANLPKHRK
jgi:hypothetical protein